MSLEMVTSSAALPIAARVMLPLPLMVLATAVLTPPEVTILPALVMAMSPPLVWEIPVMVNGALLTRTIFPVAPKPLLVALNKATAFAPSSCVPFFDCVVSRPADVILLPGTPPWVIRSVEVKVTAEPVLAFSRFIALSWLTFTVLALFTVSVPKFTTSPVWLPRLIVPAPVVVKLALPVTLMLALIGLVMVPVSLKARSPVTVEVCRLTPPVLAR